MIAFRINIHVEACRAHFVRHILGPLHRFALELRVYRLAVGGGFEVDEVFGVLRHAADGRFDQLLQIHIGQRKGDNGINIVAAVVDEFVAHLHVIGRNAQVFGRHADLCALVNTNPPALNSAVLSSANTGDAAHSAAATIQILRI